MTDYAALKWYRGDRAMAFDPGVDYSVPLRAARASRREQLRAAFDAVETLPPSGRDDLVRSMLAHWTLFREPAGGLDPAAAVVRAVRATRSGDARARFWFAPFYTIRNDAFDADAPVTVRGLGTVIDPKKDPNVAQAGATAGYRIALKDEADLFSSITLSVGYAQATSRPSVSMAGTFTRAYIIEAESHTETVTMQVYRVDVTSAKTYLVEARTPIMLLTRRLVLEGGVHCSQNVLELDHEYRYIWSNVIAYPIIGGTYTVTTRGASGTVREHRTTRSLIVRPVLTASYGLSDQFSLWAGTTVVAASAGLSLRW
jgi:hypothetical protein